ncbi:MAG TPA: peptide-methionine (S)-S-oxide reductase MsrA [bacterium]|nr:peptide-methionine (S)-S-oxide reductase MsrA [bacterium]
MDAPDRAQQDAPREEIATLAGGCFWCLEAVYADLEGVLRVESGYAGGTVPSPSYQQVCTGTTGHAEVVQVTFDPRALSYRDLLEVFFNIHDPTTLNRQGHDIGTQYRSAIYYHSPQQKAIAEQTIRELGEARRWANPIVTEVAPLTAFYKAEPYHQEYFAHNPFQPYCQAVVGPKVAKFRKQYRERLKNTAAI